jgi:hypothetical protein
VNPVRWPALVLVGAALAGLVVADQQFVVDADRDRAPLVLANESTSGDSLSSTWYCAAGYLGIESGADHAVIVSNPTDARISAALTIFPVTIPPAPVVEVNPGENVDADLVAPPPAADPGEQVETTVVVEPGDRVVVRLGDVEGVAGDAAAALVESTGGVLVEHSVTSAATGPDGADVSSGACASTAGSEWHLAGGTTRDGARQVLAVFNPFPQDAIISVTFSTETGGRAPSAYQSITVPAGAVLPIDVTGVVPLFDSTSATVLAGSGRVVVERLQFVVDDTGVTTASLFVGVPRPARQWVFAGTQVTDTSGTALVIHNPTRREARVDVEVTLDPYEGAPSLEPISVTIRPERTQTVLLSPLLFPLGTRAVVDASSRLPADAPVPVTYWTAVRSLNGVPVVVEHITGQGVDAEGAAMGDGPTTWVPGAAVSATRWETTAEGGQLVVVNPGGDAVAVVTIARPGADGEAVVTEVEVPQRGRRVIDLASFDLGNVPLVVTSDELIVVHEMTSTGSRLASPTRRTWDELDLPFPE